MVRSLTYRIFQLSGLPSAVAPSSLAAADPIGTIRKAARDCGFADEDGGLEEGGLEDGGLEDGGLVDGEDLQVNRKN